MERCPSCLETVSKQDQTDQRCSLCGAALEGEPTSKGAVESVLSFVGDQQKRFEDKKKRKAEAAAAAARAAEEEARIKRERALQFVGRYWKWLLAGSVALVLVFAVAAWNGARTAAADTRAAMPTSSSELEGSNYQDVRTKLEAAGFTKVETSAMPDLVVGWVHKDGDVEAVSVNGETSFEAGSRFAPNTKIVIRYHTFPKPESDPASSQTADTVTPSSDAQEADNAVLTERNSPEFKAVLRAENPGDPEVKAFIQKYAGRTIEFDGYTWDWLPYETTSPLTGETKTYKTLYNTIIHVGDVKDAKKHFGGPIFRVERFAMPNYSPAVNRLNIHVRATVDSYDADREFFRITDVKLEDR